MSRTAKSVGRTIGILFLVQMAVAPVVNFVPGFLTNAAGSAVEVRMAVKAGAANEVFQAAAVVVRSTLSSAHYTNLLVAGATVFVLYSVLYRFAWFRAPWLPSASSRPCFRSPRSRCPCWGIASCSL